jgi:hypothetical protein
MQSATTSHFPGFVLPTSGEAENGEGDAGRWTTPGRCRACHREDLAGDVLVAQQRLLLEREVFLVRQEPGDYWCFAHSRAYARLGREHKGARSVVETSDCGNRAVSSAEAQCEVTQLT